VRSSALDVIRAALSRPLGPLIAVYTLYLAAVAAAAASLGLWDAGLIKDTVAWYLLVGLGLLFGLSRSSEERYFRHAVARALGLTACVALFVGLRPFPLPVELVIVPLAMILPFMSLVAGRDEKLARAKRLSDRATALLGLIVLAGAAVGLVASLGEIEPWGIALQFALPGWLTLAALPFVFALDLCDAYASAFSVLDQHVGGHPSARRRGHLVLATAFWLRRRELRALHRGMGLMELAEARSWREARLIVALRRAEVRAGWASKELERTRLARFAGVAGTDWDGRPLDEREFTETKNALDYIAAVHRIQFARGRYRRDLMSLVGGLLPQPVKAGEVTMRLGRRGRSWGAWRRTPAGWWLGIGAASAPPDEWTYLGRTDPSGPPGDAPGWVHGDFPWIVSNDLAELVEPVG
jgi:hypothetical protein